MPGESKSSPREIQILSGTDFPVRCLDRIDLHLEVAAGEVPEISGDRTGETSAEIRRRVVPRASAARAVCGQGQKSPARKNGDAELKQFLRAGRGNKGAAPER